MRTPNKLAHFAEKSTIWIQRAIVVAMRIYDSVSRILPESADIIFSHK